MYINNAQKYSIDLYMSQESQSYYAIIFMPVFGINLISLFIYRPMLNALAREWVDRNITAFRNYINRQLRLLLLLIVIVMIGAYFLGIPLLSFLYQTELSQHKLSFMILIAGGGLAAVIGFLSSIITVMRSLKQLLTAYIISALFALVSSMLLVKGYGLLGAAISFDLVMLLLSSILYKIMHTNTNHSTS